MSNLIVTRPSDTTPGWVVLHVKSGRYAIQPVRYKRDAQTALTELEALDIDWGKDNPVPFGSPAYQRARPVYVKYGLLRQKQLNNNVYWPRPKKSP